MGLRRILADADDIVSGFGKCGIVVSETAGLCGASGCVVLGIEINDGLAAVANEVLLPYRVAVLVQDLEIRHSVSDFQHMILVSMCKYTLL